MQIFTGEPEKQGFFEKFLFFPYPCYPDRVMLWKHFVKKCLNGEGGKKAVPDNFDISSLAHISEGYSAGAIYKARKKEKEDAKKKEEGGGDDKKGKKKK
ncbi:hypothetical protein TrVE_jg4602 [Triparma verrucosa]|uniref:Uncharacterized protein n=1 Tax=Triparma verrucosa TaxID=1606542 RepID=A0A9W7CFK9_9STRA|nr:hypothetical protein TrVE_jg4602 [Triparma verrucosa]